LAKAVKLDIEADSSESALSQLAESVKALQRPVFFAPNISKHRLPSGKHTKSYWKWPFIVDLPIQHGDFP
jgi:hypothetical protein